MASYNMRGKNIKSCNKIYSENTHINELNGSVFNGGNSTKKLSDLTDTNIIPEDQQNGNHLTYHSSSEKWITSDSIPSVINDRNTKVDFITNPTPNDNYVLVELESRVYVNNGEDFYRFHIFGTNGPNNFELTTWDYQFRYNSDILEYVDTDHAEYPGYYDTNTSVSQLFTTNPDTNFYPSVERAGTIGSASDGQTWLGPNKKHYLATMNFRIIEDSPKGWHFGYCGTLSASLVNQATIGYENEDISAFWNVMGQPIEMRKSGFDGSVHEFYLSDGT